MISIEPGSIHVSDDAWELVEITPDFIRHRAAIDRAPNGDVTYVYKTEPRGLTELLDSNRQSFDDSHGKRFGDGRIIGRIPLNVLFDPSTQIAEKLREGDKDHLKWWLNSQDARPFRTFRGKV